jgi:hypothetical protein
MGPIETNSRVRYFILTLLYGYVVVQRRQRPSLSWFGSVSYRTIYELDRPSGGE